MIASKQNPLRQPFTGSLAATAALCIGAAVWIHTNHAWSETGSTTLLGLAIVLIGALGGAGLYPVHVHQSAKIEMTSIVLYLAAALLPPPLAAVVACAGTLIAECVVRKQRGLYASDIASQVGRLTVVTVLASLVAHAVPNTGTLHSLTLIGAALTLWVGDFISSPLTLTPITGESARTVITAIVKQASVFEAAQYLIGILGAVAAQAQLWSLALLALPIAIIYVTGKHSKELQDSTTTLLEHVADTVDLRDPYTGGHSRRVTEYARGTLSELGLHGPDVNLIILAARVHDIGKIAMPDAVLLKEGRLTDEEWLVMKEHPEKGADLLTRYPDFSRGADIVRHHHESWDGSGYPHGLRERAIPFGARVIAVADSYDAMTSDRPYRKGMSPDRAASILRAGRGTQWDHEIVDAFLRSIADSLTESADPSMPLVASAPQSALASV